MAKASKPLSQNTTYLTIINLLLGIGLGALLTVPAFLPHTARWGALFVGLGILGYLYASLKH
jgi:hypothetical protein